MYISRIYIRNFRNFDEFDLLIPNGDPLTIIGSNNSGKSNLLQALRLVLDPNLPPWAKNLSEDDFSWNSIENSPWLKGEEIVITVTFSNVSDKEEISALLYSLSPEYEGDENIGLEANISFVFSPTIYNKKGDYDLEEDYISFMVAGRYHPSGYFYLKDGTIKEYDERVLELNCCEDRKTLYKHFYLSEEEIEKIRENKEISFEKRLGKQLFSNKIRRHINLLFLDATRNVKDDFYQGYYSLVAQLLRLGIKNSKNNNITPEITKALKNLRTSSAIPNTQTMLENIERRLQNENVNFLSGKASFKIGTPKITLENVGKFFNFLVDLDEELQNELEMNVIGLGYQNLAYISAIFSLFELKKEVILNDTEETVKIIYNLLLIEEPEAHLDIQNQKYLHTQIEKRTEKLLENNKISDDIEPDISENKYFNFTQVIQTSHSTHLTSKSDLKNIVVVQKNVKKTKAVNIDEILKQDPGTYKHKRRILKQYLDATRSSLLFAKKVILVEGLSEKYTLGSILNYYLKKENPDRKNIDIDSEGIEIIEVGGKNFTPFSSIFTDKGLNNKCLNLQDGDSQLSEDFDLANYIELYSKHNTQDLNDKKIRVAYRKNMFTFEIDTFFVPNPDDASQNNIDYLKLILLKFMQDGDYFKKDETFKDKIDKIDNLVKSVNELTLDKEKIKTFFDQILGCEVSKPTMSLYLSSLLKAKLLNDLVEREAWEDERISDNKFIIKEFSELPDFIIPNYIKEGLKWLITDKN